MSVTVLPLADRRLGRRPVVGLGAGLLLVTGLGLGGSYARPPLLPEPGLDATTEPVDSVGLAAWLAAGSVPVVPELGGSTMITDALRDLYALGRSGLPVAGWPGPWCYVWPRDSALVAAALARTGHPADAERVVDFLQRVQPESGLFQARYAPDGRVPDDRGIQLDGLGWALWATDQVAATLPGSERAAFLARHRRLVDRSTATTLALIDNPRSLPPVSSDYWEVREWRRTLATAALLLAGLEAAGRLYADLGEPAAQQRADDGAARLRTAIHHGFGPDGYPRHLGGAAASVDLGVDFLLPPFVTTAETGVVNAWRGAASVMRRPAGGLAPGGSWRADGISWTTSTSTYALTAAALGERAEALHWLGWLDAHRTDNGSLPEKVTATGRPAAAAPLAWAAAAVVLAADEL